MREAEMPNMSALDSGNPDSDDESRKDKLAARAARFTQKLAGNRYKEVNTRSSSQAAMF